MPRTTYFVVQPYVSIPGSALIGACDPIQVQDAAAAKRLVRDLPKGAVGALAFSRSGDPEDGDWADAEIIAKNGRIPEADDEGDLPW